MLRVASFIDILEFNFFPFRNIFRNGDVWDICEVSQNDAFLLGISEQFAYGSCSNLLRLALGTRGVGFVLWERCHLGFNSERKTKKTFFFFFAPFVFNFLRNNTSIFNQNSGDFKKNLYPYISFYIRWYTFYDYIDDIS